LIKRKHILFLTPGFPKDEKDTRCIPAMHLMLSYLYSLDVVDISVIAFNYPYKASRYKWNGIDVHSLGGRNNKGIYKLLNWRKALRMSKSINEGSPIHHVHSFWLNDCALVGNRIAKKLAIPHSCTLMGQDVLKSNRFFKRIQPLPQLITLSEYQNQQLFSNFSISPSLTIPWGIEEMSNSNDRSIDIIGVGNLNEVKNYSRFLSIIQLLVKKLPDLKVQLIGEGEEADKLNLLVNSLNLTNTVVFLGVKNREQTLAVMKKAKLLLHTANFESFGMVFLEAQALGLKIVTTPVGIAPELNGCGTFQTVDEAASLITEFLYNYRPEPSIRTYKVEDTVHSYLNNVF
tara:strand:- start:986 stop:2020 length:1035 start_codon:yes stop_codon:yes gene_type:complete